MNNRQCEKAKKNLRDNEVPGLMLSVGRRSKTFDLYRRVDGKPRRIMLGRFPGMTVEQARRKARTLTKRTYETWLHTDDVPSLPWPCVLDRLAHWPWR